MSSPVSLALILAVTLPVTLGRSSVAGPSAVLLSDFIAAGALAELKWPDFSDLRSDVSRFYGSSDHTLAWTREHRLTPQASALVSILGYAERKGLNAEDYDGPRWDDRIAAIATGNTLEVELVRFDLALTVSAMRYVSDVGGGRIDPDFVHPGLTWRKRNIDLAEFLAKQVKNAPDVTRALNTVEPPFEGYWRTLKGLQGYLKLVESASK